MVLLDTCVLLWAAAAPERLSPVARSALDASPRGVSSLSAWEIGIRHATGKLVLSRQPARWWSLAREHHRFEELPFSAEIALLAAGLPAHHADPFDRGLVALALAFN